MNRRKRKRKLKQIASAQVSHLRRAYLSIECDYNKSSFRRSSFCINFQKWLVVLIGLLNRRINLDVVSAPFYLCCFATSQSHNSTV